jgi:hypothetical protein
MRNSKRGGASQHVVGQRAAVNSCYTVLVYAPLPFLFFFAGGGTYILELQQCPDDCSAARAH